MFLILFKRREQQLCPRRYVPETVQFVEPRHLAHKQGIVTEVSNLVNEYLQGNYNRSKEDLALLAVPQFSDDHWVQDSEEKCNLLLNVQKVKPLLEQTDEVESDVLNLSISNES